MSNDPVVVILIPGFPGNKNDSTCLPAHQNLVRHINQYYPGTKLLILSFQYPFQQKEYYWNGNKIIAFGGRNKGGIRRRWLWMKVNRHLNQVKKKHPVKAVLSFWAGECAVVGKHWAEKNGVKHICWMMGQDAKKENRSIRRSAMKGEELIVISDFLASELQKNHGLTPANILPLGVLPQPVTTTKRDIDILCAGSLIPLKQFEIAIGIAHRLKKMIPGLRMMIAGQGPERERLAGLIREYELEQNVLLAGEKDHEELLSLMKQSKLFIHPSAYEGLGMVCLEALAAGTPVISFTRPLKNGIQNWYIADSPETMERMALSLLTENPFNEPVCPFPMKDTAQRLMALLGF